MLRRFLAPPHWCCLLLVASLAAGCVTTRTTTAGRVGVDREQTMLVSSSEVNRAAAKAYQETLREAQGKNLLKMEQEADRVGIELAARAGYDPDAAISLWQKMGRTVSGRPPEWLSTHPANETRIADLRLYAERVRPLYEAAGSPP